MILTQYYEQRGQLVTEARQILDGIEGETDETKITEAEQRHDTVMTKLDDLDKKIAREERVAQFERSEEERRSRQRPNSDGGASGIDGGAESVCNTAPGRSVTAARSPAGKSPMFG